MRSGGEDMDYRESPVHEKKEKGDLRTRNTSVKVKRKREKKT